MSLSKKLGIKKEKTITKIGKEDWDDSEYCLNAVKQAGRALKFVKNQTPEVCLEAVKQNGYALQYVENQTPEVCLEAVKQNGWVLEYVKEQTLEICLEAVKQDGWALKRVKNQTLEIIQTALDNDPQAVNFIDTSVLSIKDWNAEWFRYLASVELRRQFVKERGREVFSQLGCVTVDENEEYVLVKFKYIEDQKDFQKALIFRCPSSNDVYFQEVKPSLNTVKNAVKFLNNNIRKEELAYES